MDYEGELLEEGDQNVDEKVEELKGMQEFMATGVENGPIEVLPKISEAFFSQS